MQIRELARAKINLTLSVLGRRTDGYHDIESLVTFANISDRVTFTPGADCKVAVTGPFAAAIEGTNLLDRTLATLAAADAGLVLGAVVLEKNLPIAAGLGGGSADAAALLRAVRKANPDRMTAIQWHEVAAKLGADVPVCLADNPALMRGIGDRVELVAHRSGVPPLPAVLLNPRVPLATARVFAAFAAVSPSPRKRGGNFAPTFVDIEALLTYMRDWGNDLERPAAALLPAIDEVKAALAAQPGCRLEAMSGSGPTCFGLFDDQDCANRAAVELGRAHPNWWVAATAFDWPG